MKLAACKANPRHPYFFHSLGLLVAGTLALTGCSLIGEGTKVAAGGAAGGSASSSSSPSATSSSPASSPSASASPSAPASASPSPSEASSQSNAEGAGAARPFDFSIEADGDVANYVPATETVRASNVPRPLPLEGMDEHSEDGFARFASYFMAERNYAISSGDTAKWRELVTPPGDMRPGVAEEIALIDMVDDAYANGGWVVNGHREIYSSKYMVTPSNAGEYDFVVYAIENGTIILNPAGAAKRTQWVPLTQDAYIYGVSGEYIDGRWYVVGHAGDFNQTMPVE